MTTERLEELIKQGGIVGNIDKHIAIKLNPNIHKIFYPYDGSSECLYEEDLTLGKLAYKCEVYDLEKISKKDFDKITWYNKTHAEHTERFEPPMWGDIEDYYEFTFKCKKIFCWFYVNKKHNYIDIILKKDLFVEEDDIYRTCDITKENYEKACEIVRDLFEGDGVK